MRAQRINTGFSRLGLLPAAVGWLPAVFLIGALALEMPITTKIGGNVLALIVLGALLCGDGDRPGHRWLC
jgi:hypothetical protein